jgi:hypothetical protein
MALWPPSHAGSTFGARYMSKSDEQRLRNAATQFIEAFETVFHEDWTYTKQQMGIPRVDPVENERARQELYRLFGEEPPQPRGDSNATFLDPGDSDRESDNWGNYEILLDAYTELKRVLSRGKKT